MPRSTWPLQSARTRFSALVRSARRKPQIVTKRGKSVVVVLAAEEYARLRRLEQTRTPTFAEHLLAMPQDGGEFERLNVQWREVVF